MLLLIDNYDSFTYNLVQYLGELGVAAEVRRNDTLSAEEAMALNPSAIILSPGPCTPNEAGICLDLIPAALARRTPLFGVCLGHQSLGQALGGQVIRAPAPVHGKVGIMHKDKGNAGGQLLGPLPDAFEATRYHSLVVEPASLPDCLTVTARTEDGLIMAMEHRDAPLYGVQFHPESIATPYGHRILASFLDLAGIPHREKAAA